MYFKYYWLLKLLTLTVCIFVNQEIFLIVTRCEWRQMHDPFIYRLRTESITCENHKKKRFLVTPESFSTYFLFKRLAIASIRPANSLCGSATDLYELNKKVANALPILSAHQLVLVQQ